MTTGGLLPAVQKASSTLFTLPSSPGYVCWLTESRPAQNTRRFVIIYNSNNNDKQICVTPLCLQCLGTVGWASGRASGL